MCLALAIVARMHSYQFYRLENYRYLKFVDELIYIQIFMIYPEVLLHFTLDQAQLKFYRSFYPCLFSSDLVSNYVLKESILLVLPFFISISQIIRKIVSF